MPGDRPYEELDKDKVLRTWEYERVGNQWTRTKFEAPLVLGEDLLQKFPDLREFCGGEVHSIQIGLGASEGRLILIINGLHGNKGVDIGFFPGMPVICSLKFSGCCLLVDQANVVRFYIKNPS